jgi:hypothetical protein
MVIIPKTKGFFHLAYSEGKGTKLGEGERDLGNITKPKQERQAAPMYSLMSMVIILL